MSSLQKDRFMASKPTKTLTTVSLKDKPIPHKIPILPSSAKEISRPISAGRASVARTNPTIHPSSGRPTSACRPSVSRTSNPRPVSAGRASVARASNSSLEQAEKPVAPAVRRSMSMLPGAKFTDLRSDLRPRMAGSKERRSFSGFSDFEKKGKNFCGDSEKSLRKIGRKAVDVGSNVKGVVLIEEKRFEESFHEKGDILTNDKKVNHMLKDCLNLHAAVNGEFLSKVGNCCVNGEKSLKKVGCKAVDVGVESSSGSQNGCLKNVKSNVNGVCLIEAKCFEDNCHEKGDILTNDNKANHMLKHCLDLHTVVNGDYVSKIGNAKPDSGNSFLIKPVDGKRINGAGNLESNVNGVCLIEAKCFEDNCHEKGDILTIDNKANHMLKDCLDLHTAVNGDYASKIGNAKLDSGNTFLLDVEHREETVQLGVESVRPEENIVMDVKDVCTDKKYQSKLHEKLALLEDKVQKIALEIKQTKEMLDKNKPRESKLVLFDIQKKICGVEKSMHGLKDGAKSELASSDAGKVSNMALLAGNSSSFMKGSNSEVLEARFFPHQKVCLTSFASGEQDKSCKQTFLKLNGDQKMYNGLNSELLTTMNGKKTKTENFDVNVELNHGVVEKMCLDSTSYVQCGSTSLIGERLEEVALKSNENFEEFDVLEKNSMVMECLDSEESSVDRLYEIGSKISTGGWFVSEGEAILLAHDDNSCSYSDIANNEVKSEYKPPAGLSNNLWGDCWLVGAAGADGCSGRYVVAASAGNVLESGFCSWDFYTKDVKAFHVVGKEKNSYAGSSSRTPVAPSSCWYRPCGPLLISTSGRQRTVKAYDIRDGDLVMTWEMQSPVVEMQYSCPLQWRSKCKAVIAGRDTITLWDVNSLNPQPILSIPCIGKKIYSLHVNNTDAEIGVGVRQRASSSEVEGNDGVFCTQDSVNVFDFRIPSGAGLQISRHTAANAISVFSLKDSIFIGSTEGRSPGTRNRRPQVEHFSLRKGKLVTTYVMPEFKSNHQHSSVTQVWGNSHVAMGICGNGMFVFDAFKDEEKLSSSSSSSICEGNVTQLKRSIGRDDDLCHPTFDYMESRALIISRDRPAFWKYLS